MDEIISFNARINFITRLVELSESEAKDSAKIVTKIFQTFEINPNDYVSFDLVNNHHAPINGDQIPRLIAQHKNSGCFYIEILLEQPALSLKAEGIRNYLMDRGKQKVFEEYELIGDLSKNARKMLTNGMIDFMTETRTDIRDTQSVNDVCNSMITLFPLLSIDDFYNPKAKKGLIFHRIKNMPSAKNATNSTSVQNEAELIDFLKQCVVAKDKQKLKTKLGETVELRRKILRQNRDEFQDFMAFYFKDPELILFDFGLFYESIDQMALHNKWDDLLARPLHEWKENVDITKVPTKDDNVWKFFILFDKFKSARGRFYTCIKSLVIFSEDPSVDPMHMIDGKNKHPYIIAIVSTNKKSAKYYIVVHQHFVSIFFGVKLNSFE